MRLNAVYVNHCAAISFFVVGPSGYIRVCNHSTVNLAHFREIDTLKDHPYWKTFVFKEYLPGSCFACAEMTDCDGGCREAAHITGGAVDSPYPLMS
jgi:radical SAM protein with 4Fe4S-binding SPASM domain